MLEPRGSFIDTVDVRLHYLEWDPEYIRKTRSLSLNPADVGKDTDDVPVVLLHGLGATADTWRLMAEYLYPHNLLLAFDLRGHGLSDQPEQGYDMTTIAEDIISGMAALGLGQVALVGHGWGARVALVLAARHSALISHLVLVDCPLVEPRHWPGMTRERFLKEEGSTGVYSSRESYLQIMKAEMPSFWSPEVEKIVLTYVQALPDGQIVERLGTRYQSLLLASLWEDRALSYYGKISCPVLLIPAADKPQPDQDLPEHLEQASDFAAVKGQMAAQVARAILHCSVLWMPDTTHDIQLQRPQTLAEAIINFLRQ